MASDTPTRPDAEIAAGPAESFIRRLREEAAAAWATGSRYYEASFSAMASTDPKTRAMTDPAGAIEAIEHVGYVNVTGGCSYPSGFPSPAGIQRIYLFRRPDSNG